MTNKAKRTKIVHVDSEEKMSLEQAASFLQTVASKLLKEGSFTLTNAGKTHTVSPSPNVLLEVKLEQRNNKQKLELELEWIEGDTGSTLTIE